MQWLWCLEFLLEGETGVFVTIVSSGQTLTIGSGQTSSGTIVLGGGHEYVQSGGTAVSTLVSGSAFNSIGLETVYAGGVASDTTLSNGNELISGGVAIG